MARYNAGMKTGYNCIMYFGRNIPGSEHVVTDAEVKLFLENVIDKYWQGYTVEHVSGVWKGEHEKTFVVRHILSDKNGQNWMESQKAIIRRIALTYKEAYSQDSVLVKLLPVTYEFI